jgi:hypothetical protein
LSDPGSLQSKHSLSGYVAEDLKGVLDAMGESIARIHGESDFTNQDPGYFSHAITGSAGLQIAGDADFNSSADIQGAANLRSTLDVAGLATFTGDADFNGANVGFSATVDSDFIPDGSGTRDLGAAGSEWNAYIELATVSALSASSAQIADLTDNRIVIAGVNGELEDDANFRFDGTNFDIGASGAEKFRVVVASGATTIKGAIDADSTADIADTLTLSKPSGTGLDVTANASIGGNLTVTGDLTISGTTTTLDTANLLVEDPLIVLAKNQANASAGYDLGIIMERGSDDSYGMIWDESASEFAFINAGTEDGSTAGPVSISEYADLQARTGSFHGLEVVTMAVSDLDANRLVLSDTGGELVTNANFTYNSTDIIVGGAGAVVLSSNDNSVEADIFKVEDSNAQLSIDSARYGGSGALLIENADNIALKAGADFIGFESATKLELGLDMSALDEARFLFNDGSTEAFRVDSANSAIQVSLAIPLEFRDADLSIHSFADGQLDIDADVEIEIEAPTIDMNGDALISGHLWLDGPSKDLKFFDAAGAYVGFKAPTVAAGGSVVWSLPTKDSTGSDYALVSDGAGALSWKAPSQENSKKYIIEDGAISSNTDLTTTFNLSAITSARVQHVVDVYVNGQLMKQDLVSVSYAGNVDSDADYKIDFATSVVSGDASTIKFGFALEADDIVTVIMRA